MRRESEREREKERQEEETRSFSIMLVLRTIVNMKRSQDDAVVDEQDLTKDRLL
jgi:hypothetical protein